MDEFKYNLYFQNPLKSIKIVAKVYFTWQTIFWFGLHLLLLIALRMSGFCCRPIYVVDIKSTRDKLFSNSLLFIRLNSKRAADISKQLNNKFSWVQSINVENSILSVHLKWYVSWNIIWRAHTKTHAFGCIYVRSLVVGNHSTF